MLRRIVTPAALVAGLILAAPAAHARPADSGNEGAARIFVSQACVANPDGPGKRVVMVWDVYSERLHGPDGTVTGANHTPDDVNGVLTPAGISGVGIVYVVPGKVAHFRADIAYPDRRTLHPRVHVPAWTCSGHVPN